MNFGNFENINNIINNTFFEIQFEKKFRKIKIKHF